jgi:hypothetical protein
MYPYIAGETQVRRQRHELARSAERHRLVHANRLPHRTAATPRRSSAGKMRQAWMRLASRLRPPATAQPGSHPPVETPLDQALSAATAE